MKRIFTTVISITMALVLAVFASGCNGDTSLTFNNGFYGSANDPVVGYEETLTYSVANKDDYNSTLEKSESLTDEILTYAYVGEYMTTFTVESGLNPEIETNISTENMPIYHFTTSLTLKSTYKVNGDYAEGGTENEDGTVSYDEYVNSEVYFLKAGYSFAPIWSKTEYKYSFVSFNGSKAAVNIYESSSTVNYNSGSYKITTVTGGETTTESHDYSFKSLIDNAQLLFAIRCMDISAEGSRSVPVVSTSYGTAQSLSINNTVENTQKRQINGTEADIPVKNMKFYVATQFNTGTPHYALIQKSSPTDAIPNKALLIEYAAPLITYGSFTNMGALVYTLKTATIVAP